MKLETADIPIYTKKVSLTSAQILDLFSTPVTLVNAPGVGKGILMIISVAKWNFVTSAYTTAGNALRIRCATNTTSQTSSTSLLTATSSGIRSLVYTSNINITENQALIVDQATANPTGGDSTLDLYITYQIISL